MTRQQDTLVTRIKEMENRYHELTRVFDKLDMAIGEYNSLKDELAILEDYMESGKWQIDYEADEAGHVPADLKREVLSQDALYDFLSQVDKIIQRAKATFN